MTQIAGPGLVSPPPAPDPTPPRFDRLGRLDDGFGPPKPGETRAEWLDMARTSRDPAMRAFYDELVTLAGGRTDDPALNEVLNRYQALQTASTASEVRAAERGWLAQIDAMLDRLDPIDDLLGAIQPGIAQLARDAGIADRPWGRSLQAILDAPGTAASFRDGLRAGAVAGARDLIVGTAELVGGALQYAGDSIFGRAGDALRERVGGFSGVMDSVIFSAERGARTSAVIVDAGARVGNWVSAVAADPSRLRTALTTALDAQWSRLEASHARAAAQGPQAEARWWGEAIGRVGFEVAATVAPVGVAGRIGTVARTADGAVDAGRVAGRLADAPRPDVPTPRPATAGGRSQHYFDEPGATGAWNVALNRPLQPHADYHVNGYVYATDDQGRVASVSGRLTLETADRNGYQQRIAGGGDRLPGDQGGHLIASIFNGPGEAINLKAMDGNFNMREYRSLERTLADALSSGKTVDMRIDVLHSGDSLRPDAFRVRYTIDGVTQRATFRNQAGG